MPLHFEPEFLKIAEKKRNLYSNQYQLSLVTHDLKTPLQCILLLVERLNASHPEVVGRIKNCVREIDCMIGHLQITGAVTTVVSDNVPQTHLTHVLNDVLAVCPNGETLEIDGPIGELTVPMERQHLYHILQNLVTNSLRHGGHRIRIRSGKSNGRFFLDYSDSGPGIPDKVWNTITQPPYPKSSGRNGVGLRTLAGFLRSQNAELQRSEIQNGSCLRIIIGEEAAK